MQTHSGAKWVKASQCIGERQWAHVQEVKDVLNSQVQSPTDAQDVCGKHLVKPPPHIHLENDYAFRNKEVSLMYVSVKIQSILQRWRDTAPKRHWISNVYSFIWSRSAEQMQWDGCLHTGHRPIRRYKMHQSTYRRPWNITIQSSTPVGCLVESVCW